jgi:DNA-binding NtrC family response regulator
MSDIAKPRILFVEDYEPYRKAIRFWLEKYPVEIIEVGSFNGAKERLSAETFDILLLDVRLPDGLGLDLLRALRATRDDIPCIVMSGFPEWKNEVLSTTLTTWLDKPPTRVAFTRALESAIQTSKALKSLRESSEKLRGLIQG